MSIREEFGNLSEKLKVEREQINMKLHLASMNIRDEFEVAEKKWTIVKTKAAEIADDTKETSEEYIAKAKVVGEELKEAYHRISKRLSD